MFVVPENLADFENSRRRSSITLFFSKPGLILSGDTCSPSNAIFAKQRRERSSHRRPISAARSFEESQLPAHRIPCRCDTEDELRAIIRNSISINFASQQHQQEDRSAAQGLSCLPHRSPWRRLEAEPKDRDKHFQD